MRADRHSPSVSSRTTTYNKQPTTNRPPAHRREGPEQDPFDGFYSFKNLAVWERAQELADGVLGLVVSLPRSRVSTVISAQIIRCSTSVASNIAEGHARFHPGAYRNHLSIARGPTAETISWLDLLRRRGLITMAAELPLLHLCAELMKMLTAQMVQLDKQLRVGSKGESERARRD